MKITEDCFNAKMITNFIVLCTILVFAIGYFKYATEIEDEVTTLMVDSLKNINDSLAEHESTR